MVCCSCVRPDFWAGQRRSLQLWRCLVSRQDVATRYEGKLAREREAGIKLQGEHGVMRSKFASMAQQLSQVKADLAASRDSQQAAEQVTSP